MSKAPPEESPENTPPATPEDERNSDPLQGKTTYLTRRKAITLAALAGSGLVLFVGLTLLWKWRSSVPSSDSAPALEPDDAANPSGIKEDGPIKVGLLHSLSGSMAISEAVLVDAEALAIEEINANGGILGRQIVPVIEDGASDSPTFAERAENLIEQAEVAVIFGGGTSASRKAVIPVVEANDHMLWYPLPYEGQECSKNVFYAGATPNQNIEPAVDWLLENKGENEDENKGKSFFLVGDDELFSQTLSTLIQTQISEKAGSLAGQAAIDSTIASGTAELTALTNSIQKAMPEGGVIFNSLSGESNLAFFRQLASAGIQPEKYPVMSVRLAEEEVRQIGPEYLVGHYATWSYFQTIERPENEKWVAAFKAKYGQDRVLGAPMESAYTAVHLWAQAVEDAGTTKAEAVREKVYGQSFDAPEGSVTMQPSHHMAKTARIGQVQADGLFKIVLETETPVEPLPWNQSLPQPAGYFCDWSDEARGGKYKADEPPEFD
ncbi:MAG: urea ABC transporter substrate-binding protein [Phormidesmis sp.]